jgi:hypothetical protein
MPGRRRNPNRPATNRALRELLRRQWTCSPNLRGIAGDQVCTLSYRLWLGRGRRQRAWDSWNIPGYRPWNIPATPNCWYLEGHDVCVRISPGEIRLSLGRQERDGRICFLKPGEANRLACVRWGVRDGDPVPAEIIIRSPRGCRGGTEIEFRWRPEDANRRKHVNIDLENETGRRDCTHIGFRSADPVTVDFDFVSQSPGGLLSGRLRFEDARRAGVRLAAAQEGENLPRRIDIYGRARRICAELERNGARVEGCLRGVPRQVTLQWEPNAHGPRTGRLRITPQGGTVDEVEVQVTDGTRVAPDLGIDRLYARLDRVGPVTLNITCSQQSSDDRVCPNGFDFTGRISGEVQLGDRDPSGGVDCSTVSGVWIDATGPHTNARFCGSVGNARFSVDRQTFVATGSITATGPPRPFRFLLRHPEGVAEASLESLPRGPVEATLDPRRTGRLTIRGSGLDRHPVTFSSVGADGGRVFFRGLTLPPTGGSVCWDLAGRACAPWAPDTTGLSIGLLAPSGEIRADRIELSGPLGVLRFDNPSSTTGSFYWAGRSFWWPRFGLDGTLSWDQITITPAPGPEPPPCDPQTDRRCTLRRMLERWRRRTVDAVVPLRVEIPEAQVTGQQYQFDLGGTFTEGRYRRGTLRCNRRLRLRGIYRSGPSETEALGWWLCSQTTQP